MTPTESLDLTKETELLEEVDELGNPTGVRLPRTEMHQRGLLHRTSTAIIFTDETRSQMWLQTRSRFKNDALKRGLPGGHASPGDTPLQTLQREFSEELFSGEEIPPEIVFQELFSVIKKFTKDHIMETVFEAIYAGPFDSEKLDTQEVESIDVYDTNTVLEEVDSQPERFGGSTLMVLRQYKAQVWQSLRNEEAPG